MLADKRYMYLEDEIKNYFTVHLKTQLSIVTERNKIFSNRNDLVRFLSARCLSSLIFVS